MATLSVVRPQRDTAPLRYGEPFEIIVDVDLDEPWFTAPSLGSKLTTSIDGEPDPAATFKLVGPEQVRALVNGRAEVKDTQIDDLGGPPLRASKAGRGHEVIVTSGAFQLSYGHLKRGSGKSGQVKAGEVIGQAGNTGRCVDGKGDRKSTRL